jgi:hypothetical protein
MRLLSGHTSSHVLHFIVAFPLALNRVSAWDESCACDPTESTEDCLCLALWMPRRRSFSQISPHIWHSNGAFLRHIGEVVGKLNGTAPELSSSGCVPPVISSIRVTTVWVLPVVESKDLEVLGIIIIFMLQHFALASSSLTIKFRSFTAASLTGFRGDSGFPS